MVFFYTSLWAINRKSTKLHPTLLARSILETVLWSAHLPSRNAVTSEKWTSLRLAALQEGGTPATIQEALQAWMNTSTTVHYSDRLCDGPSCNPHCPDRLTIGTQTSNNWPLWSKIVIACMIIGIMITCVVIKVWIICWMHGLEKKQETYIKAVKQRECDVKSTFMVWITYPLYWIQHRNACYTILNWQSVPITGNNKPISIACLDLGYSVNYNERTKRPRNEQDDRQQITILEELPAYISETQDIREEDESSKSRLVCTLHAIAMRPCSWYIVYWPHPFLVLL